MKRTRVTDYALIKADRGWIPCPKTKRTQWTKNCYGCQHFLARFGALVACKLAQ